MLQKCGELHMGPHYQQLAGLGTQNWTLQQGFLDKEPRLFFKVDAMIEDRLAQLISLYKKINLALRKCGELHMGPHCFDISQPLYTSLPCTCMIR
jgi:hypothetical protein